MRRSSSTDFDHSPSTDFDHSEYKSIQQRNSGAFVKNLDVTRDVILGFLDGSMVVEAAVMCMRVKHMFDFVRNNNGESVDKFLVYQQSVDEFKTEISSRSRKILLNVYGCIDGFAHALAAIAIVENLNSVNLLSLFLESRRSLLSQTLLCNCLYSDPSQVTCVLCEVFNIIQLTCAQAGHLFMHLPSTTSITPPFPLFNNTLLSLFGDADGGRGTPTTTPFLEEEIGFLESFRIKLKGSVVKLDQSFIAERCSIWLWEECKKQIISPVNGSYLVDIFGNGQELVAAEKKIRETMQGKQLLHASLGWLNTVFGFEVKSPWKKTSQLILGDYINLWTDLLEYHFMGRMEDILEARFIHLSKSVAVKESIRCMAEATASSELYPKQTDLGQVGRIIQVLDTCCEGALEDLQSFFKSPNGYLRSRNLAPFLQRLCYRVMLTIIRELETEINRLYDATQYGEPLIVSVHQSLFIGRLLLAIGKHSKQITLILGPSKLWVNKATADDSPDRLLENFKRLTRDLSITAHDIWISWVSERLSVRLHLNLIKDEAGLLRAWEETIVKEEHSADSPLEMKVSMPSMPSPYIISFLLNACEEVDRVGEHLLDGIIMQNLASKLLDKVTKIYGLFLLNDEPVESRDGVLQIILDLGFSADILSGGQKVVSREGKVVSREGVDWLIDGLVQRLDPLDWLKYKPYLVEIKRQSYLHHAVSFKFFVQLNPMYTEYLGFGVATPFSKSLMQVGSRCSKSTVKLGSMLTHGEVGRSSVILHSQASGLLSSFTNGRSDV